MSNYQAYDRLTALTQRIGQLKETRRQREIDERATGMLLQGSSPEEVEQYLVSEIAPERRGGLGGIAERLLGSGAPLGMSAMQQQVVGSRMQQAFPTPGQEAQQAEADRAADLHPLQRDRLAIGNEAAATGVEQSRELHSLNTKRIAIGNKSASLDAERSGELHDAKMREIDANIKRLELVGDPNAQSLREIGSVLGNMMRNNTLGDYDAEVKDLSGSFQQLVDRIVAGKGKSADNAKVPTTAKANGSPEIQLQMRADTPPDLQQRIDTLIKMGAPIDVVMNADEVKPYVIRK